MSEHEHRIEAPERAGPHADRPSGRLPAWLPLWLASLGVLGLVRWRSLVALEAARVGADGDAAWSAASGMFGHLLDVAILGFAGSALLESARRGRPLLALPAAAAFLAGLTGWPIAAPAFLPRAELVGDLASLGPLALVALAWTALGFVWLRASDGALRVPATVAGAVLAVLPFWFGTLAVEAPPIAVRETAWQVLSDANFEGVRYRSWPPSFAAEERSNRDAKAKPGTPPSDFSFDAAEFRAYAQAHLRQVITPAVFKEFDVGDKYTLISPPGTTLEFDVPAELGELRLRTSAGADKQCFDRRHPGTTPYDVRFEILVDGEPLWSATQRVEFGLDAKQRLWQHAGGDAGLPVRGGQTITLRTSFASDHDPADVQPFRSLWLGWSDLILEREVPTPRLHASPEHPNVVLIVMDTLRADRMSTYGYARPTTPNLTRLAERGTLYERAYSTSSWTWPSTASMLTGLYPAQHGVISNEACTLAFECESVAEVLQRRGFTTGGFSCNPLIHEDRYYDQGFEEFDAAKEFRKGDEIAPRVLDWLERNHGSRFFLYLHMADPHTPHHPHPDDLARFAGTPPEDAPQDLAADHPDSSKHHAAWDWFDHYNGVINKAADVAGALVDPDTIVPEHHQRWISDVYDASVASCDRYVGEILDALALYGLEDETLVIFTSDHGEEFLEHDRYGHGHSLFEEVVNVPLILAGPGVPRGVRAEQPVSNRHVAPTIAWYAGTKLAAVPIDLGRNLLDPRGLEPEELQLQTAKGLWDGRKLFALEGVVQEQSVWMYARRARPSDWQVLYQDETGRLHLQPGPGRRLAEQHLRSYDLLLDPGQLAPRDHDVGNSPVDDEILRRLDVQRRLKRGETLGAGDQMNEQIEKMGYTGSEDDEDGDASRDATESGPDDSAPGGAGDGGPEDSAPHDAGDPPR